MSECVSGVGTTVELHLLAHTEKTTSISEVIIKGISNGTAAKLFVGLLSRCRPHANIVLYQ